MKEKKLNEISVVIFFICAQCLFYATGQCAEDANAKLNKLRIEMQQIKYGHEQEVRDINKECDDRVEAAKQEFHKIREKYIEEKKGRLDSLNKSYKDKIQPMEVEEKTLLQSISPTHTDFVKRKK